MKKCPYCAEEVQEEAVVCRHCNRDLTKPKSFQLSSSQGDKQKNWFARHKILTGIIVIVLIMMGLASLGEKREERLANESVKEQSDDSGNDRAKEADERIYKLNESISSSDVIWIVTEVKDRGNTLRASESRYAAIADNKTTAGRFIEVHATVENTSTDLASITDPSIVDGKGREFTTATGTSEWLPQDKEVFLLQNLQPNLPKEIAFIFEVPADATGLKLKVGVLRPKLVDLEL